MEYKEMVAPYVCDTSKYLRDAIKAGKNVLLEGQLGSLKDPDHGIYPMVTSSSTLAAYGAIGAGIPPYEIKNITTVVAPNSPPSPPGTDIGCRDQRYKQVEKAANLCQK